MTISVIVPVLNELPNLPACLDSVHRAIAGAEIIAVDGGSTDGSCEWLAARPDVHFLTSARGKGPQQNAGAAVAIGEVLLFLHADCQLPVTAGTGLESVLRDSDVAGGCFDVSFAERRPFSLHVLAWGMNARARLLRQSYGDQALFVRRRVFETVEGLPDWPLFEDYELVRRFKTQGSFVVIPAPITLSARRFLKYGVWRTLALVLFLQFGYQIGVPPARLKRWFVDVRTHTSGSRARQSI